MRRFLTGVVLGALAFGAVLAAATRAADKAEDKIGDYPVDNSALTKLFNVVKQTHDADKGQFVWVLESKQKIDKTTIYVVELQDDDGVAIAKENLDFNPVLLTVNEGDKVRGVAKLPDEKVMKKVKKVVVKRQA